MRREEREFMRDAVNLAINLTPISWAMALAHFTHKWGYRRKGVKRVAFHINTRVSKAKKMRRYKQNKYHIFRIRFEMAASKRLRDLSRAFARKLL